MDRRSTERTTAMEDRTTDVMDHTSRDETSDSDLIAEETLVEEVSIDGMCGVY
jgi:mycofactocin precursor